MRVLFHTDSTAEEDYIPTYPLNDDKEEPIKILI